MPPTPEEGREGKAAGTTLVKFESGSSVLLIPAYNKPGFPTVPTKTASNQAVPFSYHFQTCPIVILGPFYGSSLTTAAGHQRSPVTFLSCLGSPSVRAVLGALCWLGLCPLTSHHL